MTEFREKWPEMRMKHLELIQNAISRMGVNGANLKGYCMTIVAALIGLSAAVSKEQILIYSIPVVVGLSFLDAAYLALERGFRNHYDQIRKMTWDSEPDFHVYPESTSIISAYFSWSIVGFYAATILVMVAISKLMPEIVKAAG